MDKGPSVADIAAPQIRDDSPQALQKKYEWRVALAISQHHFWRMLWAEFALDYHASFATYQRLLQQLDANFSETERSTHIRQ